MGTSATRVKSTDLISSDINLHVKGQETLAAIVKELCLSQRMTRQWCNHSDHLVQPLRPLHNNWATTVTACFNKFYETPWNKLQKSET